MQNTWHYTLHVYAYMYNIYMDNYNYIDFKANLDIV